MVAAAAILAGVDLVIELMRKLKVGADVALSFYNSVRTNNPEANLPEMTDAEVIERMTGRFSGNRADIATTLDALYESHPELRQT